jgi:hypothetical protein
VFSIRKARDVTSDLSLSNDRPVYVLWRIQNLLPMPIENCLVLSVFTDECRHPDRFRVELMLIESFQIRRLDFPNRQILKSTHCFLPYDQLTDGGPPLIPELPSGSAGPPFGEASGSPLMIFRNSGFSPTARPHFSKPTLAKTTAESGLPKCRQRRARVKAARTVVEREG